MLYIVSTPIGNLEDITLRAIRTLKEVDLIASEDTRHTGILLKKYEIETPQISYHSHSGRSKIEKIMDVLKEEKDVAVVSDAGTPGISDPAYSLIKEAISRGIRVVPIPGASAVLSALVMSGLPMNRFVYLGFLPVKKGRQTMLKSLKDEERTIVLYESPHRILKTLSNLQEYLGEREVAICREITKLHEELIHGDFNTMIQHFEKTKPRGEFVIVVKGEG